MNFLEIENAGFRSWPALEESVQDGIVLRYSNGYTKRANSATIVNQQYTGFESLVERYEKFFSSKGIPSIFRLPSFSNNALLDNYLEQRGYQHRDRTLVLYRTIVNSSSEKQSFEKRSLASESLEKQSLVNHQITEMSSHDWIKSFCQISDTELADHCTHLKMLERITDKTLMAVLTQDNVEVACGIGVISNGYFGVFDIATKQSERQKGYGTKLLTEMLNWASVNGASKSYLQVVASNRAAINLYDKLGYQAGYEYWYRIRY